MPEVATPNQAEREFETGTDESFKNTNTTGGATHNENQRVTYANIKRTYDVYQDLDVQAARQSLIETTRLNQIASQALQNAVETANMVGKRNLELNNLAHDSFWNPVASGAGMNLTAGAVPANRATDVSAAGVGVELRAGNPDVQGLCLALSDWSAELWILERLPWKTTWSDLLSRRPASSRVSSRRT
jgi:hypothetical protein